MRMRENSHSCVSSIGKYVRMTFMEESVPSHESMQRGQDGSGVQGQDRGVLCDRSGSGTSLPGVRGHLSKSPAVCLWQVTLAYLGLICEVEFTKIRCTCVSKSCVESRPLPLKSQ